MNERIRELSRISDTRQSDTITLRRADVEQVRYALGDSANWCRLYYGSRSVGNAIAILDAALAEPEPTVKESLTVDAERYRWIAENAMAIDFVGYPDNMVQVWHGTDPARFSAGKTLDEAIDAARGSK